MPERGAASGAPSLVVGVQSDELGTLVDLRSAYKRLLGKRLSVTVEVADSMGTKASSTRVVQIADKLVCPDGTDACNTP